MTSSSQNQAPDKPPPKTRDWHTYNLAQTMEWELFDGLLWDLLQTVGEPDYQGNGRPRISLRDVLFMAITKMYTGFSSRRHQSYVRDAQERGLLSSVPHFNATGAMLRDERTKDTLRRLVYISALPMACLEEHFSIDSTGFPTGFYGTYRETRYRKEQKKRKWIKLHAITGVKTNLIAVADAMSSRTADSPQFGRLVKETADGFQIREISADKAYSSKANYWYANEIGAEALIPFKGGKCTPSQGQNSSARQGARGKHGSAKMWLHAWHYFRLHQEEFYARYHKRSNVESSFSAIKRRFPGPLKSKDFTAQCNEVLCRVIAWNICVLVHAMYEHGIPPDFGVKNTLVRD